MKDLMFFIFITTAPLTGNAGNEQDAYHSAAIASYKQSGLEDSINKLTEKELKHIPKNLQQVVGNVFIVEKMIQERKVILKWSF